MYKAGKFILCLFLSYASFGQTISVGEIEKHMSLGQWETALEMGLELPVPEDKIDRFNYMILIGDLYLKIGYGRLCDPTDKSTYYNKSKSYFNNVLNESRTTGDYLHYFISMRRLIEIFSNNYQHDSVYILIEKELPIINQSELKNSEDYYTIINSYGRHLLQNGKYNKGAKLLLNAYNLFKDQPIRLNQMYFRILRNLAICTDALGQEAKADFYVQQSNLYWSLTKNQENLALQEYRNRNFAKTLFIYQDLLDATRKKSKGMLTSLEAKYLSKIGECLCLLEDYKKCDSLYTLATKYVGCTLGKENRYYHGMLQEHAYYLLKIKGKERKAIQLLETAKKLHLSKYQEKQDFYLKIISRLIEGYQITNQLTKLESELNNFYESIYRTAEYYVSNQSEEEQINYLQGLEKQIGRAQYYFIKAHAKLSNKAIKENYDFNFFLKDFAGARVRAIHQAELNNESPILDSLFKKRIEIRARISKSYSKGDISASNYYQNSNVIKLEKIEDEIFNITRRQFRSPLHYHPSDHLMGSINGTFLDFYFAKLSEEWCKDSLIYFVYQVEKETLQLSCLSISDTFSMNRTQSIIAEYINNLKSANKHFLVSPVRKLWNISLETLTHSSGSYFLDAGYSFNYVNSGQVFFEPENKPRENPSIFLAGNPSFESNAGITSQSNLYRGINSTFQLPGTQKEIDYIDSLAQREVNWNIKVLSDTMATEQNIKKSLSNNQFSAIHFATHGIYSTRADTFFEKTFNFSDPLMNSGLFFLDDENEDGFLNAYELASYDFSETDLVILSACQSGLGDLSTNEGVFGLQRTFSNLGVPNMIVALWNVPDQITAEFMISFYSYLAANFSYFDAFMKAKKQIRSQYEDPELWGGLIYLGKPSQPEYILQKSYFFTAMIICILVYFLFFTSEGSKFSRKLGFNRAKEMSVPKL